MVLLVFFGPMKTVPEVQPGLVMGLPLAVLACLSVVAGFVELPPTLGDVRLFSSFVSPVLPPLKAARGGATGDLLLQVASAATTAVGLLAAWWLGRQAGRVQQWVRLPAVAALHRLWSGGWGFDWLYDRLFVRPLVAAARVNQADFVDWLYRQVAAGAGGLHRILSATQTGQVRWYAAGMVFGAVILIAILVLV
jgi:NADH-quinone oxidoreductase subunit L